MSVHAKAKDIFLDAEAIPAADRPAFVEQACGGDAELRREVESLLQYYDEESTNEAEPAAGAAFVPGAVIAGRYRMIARIGQGGMGDVWRADDLMLDTAVSVQGVLPRGLGARGPLLYEKRPPPQNTHPPGLPRLLLGGTPGPPVFSLGAVR